MNWPAAAKTLASALGAIDQVVKNASTSDAKKRMSAADAVIAVGAIVDTVKNGDLDNLYPEAADAELKRLIGSLDDNDSSADAAVTKKFDSSET